MLQTKRVYKNHFLELRDDIVELPDGKRATRTYVKHNGAAAVLPITKDGKIILTKQYRYPVHQVSIEIPAGKKDGSESGLECVKREIEEETGYNSNNFKHIANIHNCIAYSDEMIEIFIAYDCVLADNRLMPDDDEFIEAYLVTLDEATELARSNKITDLKTLYAIEYYRNTL